MSNKKITVQVVTPEGLMYSSESVEHLICESESGTLGIKADHEPYLAVLKPSPLQIYDSEGSHIFAISGGILRIELDSMVEIFTDNADRADLIDLKMAEDALKSAEELLANIKESVPDLTKIQKQILFESVKIEVKKKWL